MRRKEEKAQKREVCNAMLDGEGMECSIENSGRHR
jgi:hypothetical protein